MYDKALDAIHIQHRLVLGDHVSPCTLVPDACPHSTQEQHRERHSPTQNSPLRQPRTCALEQRPHTAQCLPCTPPAAPKPMQRSPVVSALDALLARDVERDPGMDVVEAEQLQAVRRIVRVMCIMRIVLVTLA